MADPLRGTVIIAVGDEVLGGFIADTNSQHLARRVREAGYTALRIEVVGDREEHIAASIRRAVSDTEVGRIVVGGGLGPTTDDRTLAGVALALGVPLEEHPEALRHVQAIVARLHQAGWIASDELSEANRRMTVVPRGALVLENRRGMAPALAYRLAPDPERWLFVLPGVPREFTVVIDEELIPRFFTGGTAPHVAEVRYRFAVEAEFFEPMRTLERDFPDVSIGSYPQSETRELVIRARGADPARVEAALAELRRLRPPD